MKKKRNLQEMKSSIGLPSKIGIKPKFIAAKYYLSIKKIKKIEFFIFMILR